MTAKNLKLFNYAKSTAEFSDFKKTQVGCVVVLGNKILSSGFNTHKTSPIQKYYNKFRNLKGESVAPKLHAETHALIQIKNLDIDWSKVDIYIFRIYKGSDRNFGVARPCDSCMAFIKNLGIKNIYYTTNTGFAHEKLIY